VTETKAVSSAVIALLEGPGCQWPGFTWNAVSSQLIRINVRAADLCDGAAVGSSRFRPNVDDTGLANLTYCGTWTRTGINSSCVEAAVMSGMAAARAISGEERVIVGENFLAGESRVSPLLPRSMTARDAQVDESGAAT
jgi:hypothetical protein